MHGLLLFLGILAATSTPVVLCLIAVDIVVTRRRRRGQGLRRAPRG